MNGPPDTLLGSRDSLQVTCAVSQHHSTVSPNSSVSIYPTLILMSKSHAIIETKICIIQIVILISEYLYNIFKS